MTVHEAKVACPHCGAKFRVRARTLGVDAETQSALDEGFRVVDSGFDRIRSGMKRVFEGVARRRPR